MNKSVFLKNSSIFSGYFSSSCFYQIFNSSC